MLRLTCSILLTACLPLAPGCGGGNPAGPDGGPPSGYSLEILNPPGDSIGLPFAESETLRVRYLDDRGDPVPGADVRFSLVASGQSEATGGATLSSDTAIASELGVARVQLTAGSEEVNFRVQVTAPYAPPALFYIAVSAEGFVQLRVEPSHQGWRDPASFESVEVRLYMAEDLRCADLDIDDPPASVLPPRSLGGFGETAVFPNLAGRAYTVVAWTLAGSDTRLSFACADLTAEQVPIGRPLRVAVNVRDRPLSLAERVAVRSSFDLSPVQAELEQALPDDPWRVLACPLGPAQLLIDCALDAHSPDGALDCRVNGPEGDGLIAAVEEERGAPDENGCRPATAPGGGDSLDQTLLDTLDGGFPLAGAGLEELLAAREATLAGFELRSEIRAAGGVARHRLLEAAVEVGGELRDVPLLESARPVVEQPAVPALLEGDALELEAHGFTLRYGSIAGAAFRAGGLEPAGLGDRAGELGAALVESAGSCSGLAATICTAVGRSSTCLDDCPSASEALDDRLEAWHQHLDGAGLDFQLESGAATLIDSDLDLLVDGIGSAQAPGSWAATLFTATDSPVQVTGDMATPPEELSQ